MRGSRLLVDGRGESGVDDHDGTLGVAELRNARHVDAAKVGVRRGLGEKEGHVVVVQRRLRETEVQAQGSAQEGHSRLAWANQQRRRPRPPRLQAVEVGRVDETDAEIPILGRSVWMNWRVRR